MKKLLMSSAVVALLLVGCRDSEENLEDTDGQIETPTEELEENENNNDDSSEANAASEDDTDNIEEPVENIIGALTDHDPVPRKDYDETPMVYTDMDFLGEDIFADIYVEDDRTYLATDNDKILSLDSENNQVWSDENRYRLQADFVVDDTQVYNPAHLENIRVFDKVTGELNYEIETPEDIEELSYLTIDDDAIYLAMGMLEDPEEDTFARNFTLHKYNKATGEEMWNLPFDAVRLAGGRSTYYEFTQNDDLIFLVEQGQDKGKPYEEYRPVLTARSKEDGSVVWTEDFGAKDIQLRQGLTHVTEDTVYVIDPDYTIYGFDMDSGEKVTEFVYPGVVPGAMNPQPMFIHDELLVWQDVTETYHNMKAVNLATGEELWTLELDGHFLVDYALVDDILYAFFGSIDYEAEEYTMVARMNPETGEILTLADMGASISAKYNNYDARMGMTEHEGKLAYFFDNHLYVFNE